MRSLSEAEPRSRGRLAPERGGTSPEGATGPRARQNLARGGDLPPSETETHPRGRPAEDQERPSGRWMTAPQ
jgi:hypothetical protein